MNKIGDVFNAHDLLGNVRFDLRAIGTLISPAIGHSLHAVTALSENSRNGNLRKKSADLLAKYRLAGDWHVTTGP